MAVKIRLARAGTHKRPYYWIVAADERMPRDGRYLEKLGTYDPRSKPKAVELKEDRVHHWLDRGARPTEAVREILREKGLLKMRRGQAASASTDSSAGAPE